MVVLVDRYEVSSGGAKNVDGDSSQYASCLVAAEGL